MIFRIVEFVKKEFIELSRDRKTLMALLAFPTVLLMVFTYAAKTDIEDLPVAVYDRDDGYESRRLVESFLRTKYFELCARYSNFDDLGEALDSGKCFMGIVIPPGFGDDLRKSGPQSAEVQLIVDGSIPATARQASSYGKLIASYFFGGHILDATGGTTVFDIAPVQLESRVLYNPELDAILFMIPGLVGYILTFLTVMIAAMAIIREREAGTFEQLLVTPLTGFEIIVGKLVPFGLISLLAVAMILAVSVWWFGLEIRGSLFVFTVGLVMFIIASLNLGFFISSISKNQIQSAQLTIFYMLPSLILSGMYFPIFSMPKFFQYVSYIVPLRYFLVIMRSVTLKGAGFEALWKDFAGIGAFLVVSAVLTSFQVARNRS